jgi:hypothetical protein
MKNKVAGAIQKFDFASKITRCMNQKNENENQFLMESST